MANNRMYLRCTVCGGQFMLCKYYPSTGWYFHVGYSFVANNQEELMAELKARPTTDDDIAQIEKLDQWLDEHRHDNFSMDGPMHYVLEFEAQ